VTLGIKVHLSSNILQNAEIPEIANVNSSFKNLILFLCKNKKYFYPVNGVSNIMSHVR
jgi:hypothetical protein